MDRGIDVWSASLDVPPRVREAVAACLSDDEQVRASRFVYPRDRERFVAGRAFLRHLLARCLAADPRGLRFRYGPHGKPQLEDGDLSFNLAHADGLAVCAVTAGACELGVDVERVRPIEDLAGLARTALSPAERARLERLPEHERLRSFFEAWTRKEAFLKAMGSGLGRALDSFDVAFGPGETPRILESRDEPADARRFALVAFEPHDGYVGALAASVHGASIRLQHWEWS